MNFFLAASALGTWLDSTFYNFDMTVFRFFGGIANDFLDTVAQIFTSMGAVSYTILFAVCFGLVLVFFRRTRKMGFAIIFAVIIGTILTNLVIKPLFVRIRPYNTLQSISEYFGWYTGAGALSESDYSFPSGHTTAAFEIAVVLCMCHASCRQKKIAWIFPLIACLVGCSRVYLMVHYASDVIGGVVIGLISGIAGYFISKAVCRAIDSTEKGRHFDLERAYGRRSGERIGRGQAAPAIICTWLIIFIIAFLPIWTKAHTDVLRCSYDGTYKCYNEARTDDKYPPIDGKYYCKIHWKELTDE